jgi:transcriptional regulator with XRE-family HTH domain
MPTSPNLHLRGFRKRSGLTQADVARLMGRLSPSPVSRMENGEQAPDFRTALLLEVIFGATASQLFRGHFMMLAKKVRERAQLFDDGLKLQTETADIRRRRSELKAIIARIDRLVA